MRPIPVDFHIGPLLVHTYGVGLAITFYFAYRYFMRKLVANGYPSDWLATTFVAIIVASIIGARLFHVVANLGYYDANPQDVFAIWNGGLSSFGGLAFGIPVGLWSAHRRCPRLRVANAADLVAPVLAIAWAMGRLLGPQLMVAGGGKPTQSWVGMYYAGQIGRRLPVPLFQAVECIIVFVIALWIEKLVAEKHWPTGVVTGVVVGLWSLSRFFDQFLWLTHDNGTDAIEVASLILFVLGLGFAAFRISRRDHDGANSPSESLTVTS